MIKIHRRTHFGFFSFFPKITDFADFSFLKLKIDLELDFSKSEFTDFNILADFVVILKFDRF
jgi:hypothetical protein